MSSDTERAKSIFLTAIEEYEPKHWPAFLGHACGNDGSLRAQVERLLRSHSKLGTFHEEPAEGVVLSIDEPAAECTGQTIGRYKLLHEIGEGGFGVVYLAEQQDPVRREVALKIIKLGMDTKQVISRFEAERQALAMMDHPNIAQVHDAGATETGRPYFVMELVQGVPITKHCDDNHLTTNERLQLFLDVCRAIQHAHLKGIIHRDIKPTNVMVTPLDGEPFPKVIDFGIAKATQKGLTEKTSLTSDGQFLGTPQYMSPEQAGMSDLDVDIRTDVYSLGVLLYELLVDSTPFDPEQLRQAGYDDMRRIIRETDPPTPSSQLSTLVAATTEVFKRRRTQPAALRKQLRGDLDCIVMKTLEKDRDDRYATVQALADDVRRHLQDVPIRARRPTFLERMVKKSRRHRAAMIFAGILTTVVVVGSIVSATLLWNEQRKTASALALAQDEQRKAEQKVEEAQAISDFLVDDLLGSVDPKNTKGREVTVKEAVDNAEAKIDAAFRDKPVTEAAIRQTLAKVFVGLGRYIDATSQAERARELFIAHLGAEHVDTLSATHNLADVLREHGAWEEARELCEQVWEKRRRILGPEHADTLNTMNCLGEILLGQGEFQAAREIKEQLLETQRRVLGPEHPDTLRSMNELAIMVAKQGKLEEARKLFEEVLEKRRRIFGQEHPDTLKVMHNLTIVLMHQEDVDGARKLNEQVLDAGPRVLGPYHPDTLPPKMLAVELLHREDKQDEALKLAKSMLEVCRRNLGLSHPHTDQMMNNVAYVLFKRGEWEEVRKIEEQLVETRLHNLGADRLGTFVAMGDLIVARMTQDGIADLPGFSKEADSIERAKEISPNIFFLATAYWQLGDKEEARRWYDKAAAWMDEHKPDDKDLTRFRDEAAKLIGSNGEDESPNDQED